MPGLIKEGFWGGVKNLFGLIKNHPESAFTAATGAVTLAGVPKAVGKEGVNSAAQKFTSGSGRDNSMLNSYFLSNGYCKN